MSSTGRTSRWSPLPTPTTTSRVGMYHPLYHEFVCDARTVIVHQDIHLVNPNGILLIGAWTLIECPLGCGRVWIKASREMAETAREFTFPPGILVYDQQRQSLVSAHRWPHLQMPRTLQGPNRQAIPRWYLTKWLQDLLRRTLCLFCEKCRPISVFSGNQPY